jgi:ribosome biogenesis GTPase / thiamine phosphate phosphatase
MVELHTGRVEAAHGRYFRIKEGEVITDCVTRGKKGGVACGDHVEFNLTHSGSGVIERVLPRNNLLYRSDEMRTKLIAANVDQVLVVVAAVPMFREELLIRCILACEVEDIPVRIILNKIDLPESAALEAYLQHYVALGYPLVPVSALGDLSTLEAAMAGKTSVFVGASGMGKSSLLNRLVPEANAAVGEISIALDAGKHTTTHAQLHALPRGGDIIDSPGMQEFGLQHLDMDTLMAAFPEIRQRKGECRFYNCQHLKEPSCAVRNALETGDISAVRMRVYESLAMQIAKRASGR